MWRGFAETARAGPLVLRAWCMWLLYSLIYLLVRAIADGVSVGILGHPLIGGVSWWTGTTGTVVVMALVGRWIALRAPARAMSAGLILSFYTWAIAMGVVIARAICNLHGVPTGWQWIGAPVQVFVHTLPFLAGAMIAPRRAVR